MPLQLTCDSLSMVSSCPPITVSDPRNSLILQTTDSKSKPPPPKQSAACLFCALAGGLIFIPRLTWLLIVRKPLRLIAASSFPIVLDSGWRLTSHQGCGCKRRGHARGDKKQTEKDSKSEGRNGTVGMGVRDKGMGVRDKGRGGRRPRF